MKSSNSCRFLFTGAIQYDNFAMMLIAFKYQGKKVNEVTKDALPTKT